MQRRFSGFTALACTGVLGFYSVALTAWAPSAYGNERRTSDGSGQVKTSRKLGAFEVGQLSPAEMASVLSGHKESDDDQPILPRLFDSIRKDIGVVMQVGSGGAYSTKRKDVVLSHTGVTIEANNETDGFTLDECFQRTNFVEPICMRNYGSKGVFVAVGIRASAVGDLEKSNIRSDVDKEIEKAVSEGLEKGERRIVRTVTQAVRSQLPLIKLGVRAELERNYPGFSNLSVEAQSALESAKVAARVNELIDERSAPRLARAKKQANSAEDHAKDKSGNRINRLVDEGRVQKVYIAVSVAGENTLYTVRGGKDKVPTGFYLDLDGQSIAENKLATSNYVERLASFSNTTVLAGRVKFNTSGLITDGKNVSSTFEVGIAAARDSAPYLNDAEKYVTTHLYMSDEEYEEVSQDRHVPNSGSIQFLLNTLHRNPNVESIALRKTQSYVTISRREEFGDQFSLGSIFELKDVTLIVNGYIGKKSGQGQDVETGLSAYLVKEGTLPVWLPLLGKNGFSVSAGISAVGNNNDPEYSKNGQETCERAWSDLGARVELFSFSYPDLRIEGRAEGVANLRKDLMVNCQMGGRDEGNDDVIGFLGGRFTLRTLIPNRGKQN